MKSAAAVPLPAGWGATAGPATARAAPAATAIVDTAARFGRAGEARLTAGTADRDALLGRAGGETDFGASCGPGGDVLDLITLGGNPVCQRDLPFGRNASPSLTSRTGCGPPLTALRLEAEAVPESADPDGRLATQVRALENAVTRGLGRHRRGQHGVGQHGATTRQKTAPSWPPRCGTTTP